MSWGTVAQAFDTAAFTRHPPFPLFGRGDGCVKSAGEEVGDLSADLAGSFDVRTSREEIVATGDQPD
jgi:hypothetical protein